MQDTNNKLLNTIFKNNLLTILFILLVSLVSFLMGSLATKVSFYEKGVLSGGSQNNVLAGADGGNAPTLGDPTGQKPAGDVPKPTDKDHTRGDMKAEIALIEYSDFSCPFCKRFHTTAQQAVNEYKGKVKWVYRHFPLTTLHPNAFKQAEASECITKYANQDKFWEFADKMAAATEDVNADGLKNLAKDLGVDQNKFSTCLDGGEMTKIVDADYQSGISSGVDGTPGNFLMNIKTGEVVALRGAVPYEQLKAEIDAMLN